MFNTIALWLGKGIIFAVGIILINFAVALTINYFWKKYFSYIWLKYRHLLPWNWKDEEWWSMVQEQIKINGKRLNLTTTQRKDNLVWLEWNDWPKWVGKQCIVIKKNREIK